MSRFIVFYNNIDYSNLEVQNWHLKFKYVLFYGIDHKLFILLE